MSIPQHPPNLQQANTQSKSKGFPCGLGHAAARLEKRAGTDCVSRHHRATSPVLGQGQGCVLHCDTQDMSPATSNPDDQSKQLRPNRQGCMSTPRVTVLRPGWTWSSSGKGAVGEARSDESTSSFLQNCFHWWWSPLLPRLCLIHSKRPRQLSPLAEHH